MSKKLEERQEAIRKLVADEMIENQERLVELLKERFGVDSNQVQVSRDLRELGIGKKKVNEKMVYELPETNQTKELLRLAIRDVQYNESLIVVKTVPGLAAFVGDHLDSQEDIGVLGTLAGENIVFVTPLSVKTMNETYKQVCRAIFYKPARK